MGVAEAIAALSMRLRVGMAASVAANVLARPEFVTICKIQNIQNKRVIILTPEKIYNNNRN